MSKSPQSTQKSSSSNTEGRSGQSSRSDPRNIPNNLRRPSSNRLAQSYLPVQQARTVSSPEDVLNARAGRSVAPREPTPFAHPYGLSRSRTALPGAGAASTSRDRRPPLSIYHNASPFISPLETPSSTAATPSELSNAPILSPELEEDVSLASNIIYERQLLQKKHGFPLWIPHPNSRLPKSYTDKGVSVGDVGIVTPYGAFDYLFNVCLHAEHPSNSGPLPEGFVPLLIQQKDICETPEHGSGSFLCSSSISSVTENVGSISFQSQDSEGAILTMPEGAIHEDVRNLAKFREYAAIHAHNWYKFANGVCGREIENGELHLVTGCDKTTSCGMAAFSKVSSAQDSSTDSPISLNFVFKMNECSSEKGEGCTCSWGQTGNADVKAFCNTPDADGIRHRNQCTFFRSHTVSLSDEEWLKVQQAVTASSGGEGYASDSTSDTASRASNISKNALRRLFSTFSQKSSSSSKSPALAEMKSFTVSPRRCPHPSSVINQLLLQKYSHARVAITHDDEWALLIPDPTNPPPVGDLWEDIQLKFDVVSDASGSVYLALKEAFSVKLDQNSILAEVGLPQTANSLLSPLPFSAAPITPSDSEQKPNPVDDQLIDMAGTTPESLIDSIAASPFPSPREARLLAKMLAIHPVPPFPVLQRALFPLFADVQSPDAGVSGLRTLAFDVMASYWQNPYVKESEEARMTSERLSCLTFFLDPTLVSWSLENWRSQFKAFQAVTKGGTEIKGVEIVVIDMLKRWLLIAFQWHVQLSTVAEAGNMAECEQCVETVGQFLVDILRQKDNIARIYDEDFIEVLRFHSSLLDQLILIPRPQSQSGIVSPASPTGEKSLRRGHRKTGSSSLSLASIVFAATPSAQSGTPSLQTHAPSASFRHPAELAISLFIEQLSDHLLSLKGSQLMDVLPPLFRALAWCASPLPRLTLHSTPQKATTLEDRIVELLNRLVPSASFPTCIRALKLHLFPADEDSSDSSSSKTVVVDVEKNTTSVEEGSVEEDSVEEPSEFPFPASPPDDEAAPAPEATTAATAATGTLTATSNTRFFDSLFLMIMTSLGASRTLRNFVRKALAARLENVYHTQGLAMDASGSRGATTSNRSAIDQDLLDVVWLRHQHSCAEQSIAAKIKPTERTLASSIDAWIAWDTELPEVELHSSQYQLYEKVRDGREHILEEEAGILKDIYQEFDSREEADVVVAADEAELEPVNDALKCLSTYLVSLKSPDGTPFVVNAFQPLEAPTQLLHVITTLLSRDFSRNSTPLLAEILVMVCDHVSDENTAHIPVLMMKYHQLTPISPQWIENWTHLLNIPTLLDAKRPLTREAIIVTLNNVYFDVKDIPTHRQMLAAVVITSTTNILGPEFCDPLWQVLEDDAVTVVTEMSDNAEEQKIPPSIRLLMDLALSQPETTAQPAIRTLINVFCQISFTTVSASQTVQKVSSKLFVGFIKMVSDVPSVPCRLMLLQFLTRLRADRNHHLYLAVEHYDTHGLISYLSSLINRVPDSLMQAHRDEILEEHVARAPPPRQARPRPTGTKNPQASQAATRPRSHTIMLDPPPPSQQTKHTPLWQLPETLPFRTDEADAIKGSVISYDPDGPDRVVVLPVSRYLHALATVIETDPSWELVSYILCHLPTQLSNKHLFCGPITRVSITKLLLVLSTGVIREHLASQTADNCPENLRLRDLQGLAHHTLSTMISYKVYFDLQQRQLLLDAFQTGLNGPFSTIKCCLHALTLTAYEIPNNLSKALPQILEKLSQIMSNPNMAVHILAFLNIVGKLPSLYASFTEDDFKMVFGVALQYLQHYNELRESPTRSWALSQHVRLQSYCAVYTWFVVLKVPDRQRHIPYITRQLLLANEGKEQVDGLTQVCFDWLARNTFGTMSSKVTINDTILLPNIAKPEHYEFKNTWTIGHMLLSLRPTHRPGWVEIMARRPSGSCSLVCRRESFLKFARTKEVREIESFIDAFEKATADTETITSPTKDVYIPEAVAQPTVQDTSDAELVAFASRLLFHLSPNPPEPGKLLEIKDVTEVPLLPRTINLLDKIPVIDTHKVGVLYVAPGQTNEADILRNAHGSQAYTRFLDGLGELINIRTEKDIYTGALDPDEDGEYHYAWGDDIRQILFHTATLMPNHENDPNFNYKKRHIGNDYVRIVWNDSGIPYRFDTLNTQFQFINIVIEPHSVGKISAFSNDAHENEYFCVSVQSAQGMTECTPVGQFKIVSAVNLPSYTRQLVVLTDVFTGIFATTHYDTQRTEIVSNWNARLNSVDRFKKLANDYFQKKTEEQRMTTDSNAPPS